MFVGYEEVSKAYRVYDIDAQRVVISRDVTFDESSLGDLSFNIFDDLEEANLDLTRSRLAMTTRHIQRTLSRLESARIVQVT